MAEENGTNGNPAVKEETADSKPNAGGKKRGGKDDVCRDFLNGICNRGNRCRFRHPEGETEQSIVPYTFCNDFQNSRCMREGCRFVHATPDDVERYKSKGIVSLSLARAIAATLTINDSINGIPICKEFQTGTCSRGGNRCRYWHVNVEEERAARANMGRMGHGARMGIPLYSPGMRRPPGPDSYEYDSPAAKRAYPGLPGHIPPMGMEAGNPYVTSLERRNAELEKENEALRRELEREKTRYEDLMAVFKNQHHPPSSIAPVPPPVPTHHLAQHPQYGAWPPHHDAHWG